MSAPDKDQQLSYGELMNCLMKERDQYATEEEFKAYALSEVRRLITDLRGWEIELSVRNQTGRLTFASPKE